MSSEVSQLAWGLRVGGHGHLRYNAVHTKRHCHCVLWHCRFDGSLLAVRRLQGQTQEVTSDGTNIMELIVIKTTMPASLRTHLTWICTSQPLTGG